MNSSAPTTILIADDDPAQLMLSEAALAGAGFLVHTVTDGDEAVARYAEVQPDCVVLDVNMPRMSGIDACREIRKQAGGRLLPILMLTGRNDLPAISDAYSAGASDFAQKGMNPRLVVERVRFLLRDRALQEELRSSRSKLLLAQSIARVGHWELAPDGRTLHVSPMLGELLGVDPARLGRYEDFVALLESAERHDARTAFVTCATGNGRFGLDHRIRAADGATIYLHQEADLVDGAGGPDDRVVIVTFAGPHAPASRGRIRAAALLLRHGHGTAEPAAPRRAGGTRTRGSGRRPRDGRRGVSRAQLRFRGPGAGPRICRSSAGAHRRTHRGRARPHRRGRPDPVAHGPAVRVSIGGRRAGGPPAQPHVRGAHRDRDAGRARSGLGPGTATGLRLRARDQRGRGTCRRGHRRRGTAARQCPCRSRGRHRSAQLRVLLGQVAGAAAASPRDRVGHEERDRASRAATALPAARGHRQVRPDRGGVSGELGPPAVRLDPSRGVRRDRGAGRHHRRHRSLDDRGGLPADGRVARPLRAAVLCLRERVRTPVARFAPARHDPVRARAPSPAVRGTADRVVRGQHRRGTRCGAVAARGTPPPRRAHRHRRLRHRALLARAHPPHTLQLHETRSRAHGRSLRRPVDAGRRRGRARHGAGQPESLGGRRHRRTSRRSRCCARSASTRCRVATSRRR